MAVPKRKVSKASHRAQRSQWLKMAAPARSTCANCRESIRPHRVCPNCGHYKGREVIKSA